MSTKTARAPKNAPVAVIADAKTADSAHKAARIDLLSKIETADDLMGTALIAALSMTITLGRTDKEEVAKAWPRCGSPDVYASIFNLGDKAQRIVGQKLAQETIDLAVRTGKGSAFNKAKAALAQIVRAAKEAGVKEFKPGLARMTVKAAVVKATTPKEPAAAAAPGPKRGTKSQDTATLATAAAQCGKSAQEMAAFVLLASQNAHRMPAPEGREEAYRLALKSLEDASEAWAVFRRK